MLCSGWARMESARPLTPHQAEHLKGVSVYALVVVVLGRVEVGCDLLFQVKLLLLPMLRCYRFKGVAIHGGAHPLRIGEGQGPERYLSVFHTKDPSLRYQNYAYTFEKSPPFRIQSISRAPLQLRGDRVRFVSSLTFLNPAAKGMIGPLIGVSYGSDDKEVNQ